MNIISPTILSEFRRTEPGPDSDALLVTPHEATPERGPVDGEVGLLDVADPGRKSIELVNQLIELLNRFKTDLIDLI